MNVHMCDIPSGWTKNFPRPIMLGDQKDDATLKDYFRRHGVNYPSEVFYMRFFNQEVSVVDFKNSYHIALPDFVCEILTVLEQNGHEAYAVGGAVRDSLLGRQIKDWDVSTSARPEEVTRIFENISVPVHPTGIEHGTVTVVVFDQPCEITTFREDVATDGRRAVVKFSDSIVHDAFRRDLTINALYANREGRIFDPTTEGLYDLFAGKIRMVGQAKHRIAEDTLRVLRAVRFAGQLNFEIESHTLYTIRQCEDDVLMNLSLERIVMELEKIKPDRLPLISRFLEPIFGLRINFVPPRDPEVLNRLEKLPWYYTYLVSGVPGTWFVNSHVISKDVKKKIKLLLNLSYGLERDSWDAAYRFGLKDIQDAQEYFILKDLDLARKVGASDLPPAPFYRKLPDEIVPLPVSSSDFIDEFQGVDLGRILDIATSIWCEYRFALTKEEVSKLARIKYNSTYG